MFANIGKDKDFQERDWVARFYKISAEERALLQEGDTINIIAPGAAAVSTPRPQTEAEKLLESKKEDFRQTQQRWNSVDKSTREIETSDPDSVDSMEIRQKLKMVIEVEGSSYPEQEKKDAYPRGQNQKKPPPGKTVVGTYSKRFNQATIDNANRWGGGVDLINKWSNAVTFRIRIEIVTRYIAEKERLENKIAAERVLVVPPKPAAIEKILADLRRHGRTSADPFEKEKILKLISKLEQIRERSYAMWKEKK